MTNPLNPIIALPMALVMTLAGVVIWYVLVRSVPQRHGRGVIVGSERRPQTTTTWSVPRMHRGLEYVPRTERRYLSERTVYRIRLKDRGIDVHFAVPGVKEIYHVGDEVEVTYFERRLPGIWSSIFVSKVKMLPETGR